MAWGKTPLFLGLAWLLSLPARGAGADDSLDAYKLVLYGRTLSSANAKMLERRATSHLKDFKARAILLGYYFQRQFQSKAFQKARGRHILWVIQNHPDSPLAGLPEAQTDPYRDAAFYQTAKAAWLDQVEKNKSNTVILANAADFLQSDDKDTAEKLLLKGREMEPKNADWPRNLGRLYRLRALRNLEPARTKYFGQSLGAYETALGLETDETKKFYLLPFLAADAFECGNLEKSKGYCGKILADSSNLNYAGDRGDALHRAYTLLGRAGLKSGDVKEAKACLLKAGKTPGSSLLDSFGPNMSLAKELLEKGERESVIRYFKLCSKFWRDRGKLKAWTAVVKRGKIPDFGPNLEY